MVSRIARFALVCTIALAGATPLRAGPQAGEVLIDRIAAVVGGHPILFSEVQQKVTRGPLVTVSDYPADETSQPFARALQDAVNFELVMQRAKELEIDVRDEEVDSEIKGFLESRGLEREGLQKYLDEQGLSYEDYKADFRDQMILRRFQGRVIAPLVKVTDKDVETYYLKKSGQTSDLLELTLRQILISVPAGSSDEVVQAKRQLALDVYKKLQDGMAFDEAVKVYSDDAKARETGGLMPGIKPRDLSGAIRSEVELLEVGQFTPPVRTSLGFHVFYLEEKQFAGGSEFEQQKRRLEMELKNVELALQTRRWLTEQRQRTKIEIVPDVQAAAATKPPVAAPAAPAAPAQSP